MTSRPRSKVRCRARHSPEATLSAIDGLKVSEYDDAAMNGPSCLSCDRVLDAGDNFCRNCGLPVGSALPTVRSNMSTTVWQPTVSPVVKGAAVMAAGTVGQFLFRRMVSGLLGRHGHARASRGLPARRARTDDGLVDEAQIITEMIMTRRVRVRRQA